MFQAALLPLVLAASTASTAVAVNHQVAPASVQTVADKGKGGDEIDFIEKYFPFSFSKNLEAETEDKFVLLYISGVLTPAFLGSVWLPVLTLGNPNDYVVDALLGALIQHVPIICSCFFLYPVFTLYLMPVYVVNTFDRNLKQAKKDGSWKAAQHEALKPRTDSLAMAY